MEDAHLCRLHVFEIQRVIAVCELENIFIFLLGGLRALFGFALHECVCFCVFSKCVATAIQCCFNTGAEKSITVKLSLLLEFI